MVSTEELSDIHLNVKMLSGSISGMQTELMQAEQHIANKSPESAEKIVKTLKRHSRTLRKKAKKRLDHIDRDFSSLVSYLKAKRQSIDGEDDEGKKLTEIETEIREKLNSLTSDKKLLNEKLMNIDEVMKVILHMEEKLVPNKNATSVGEEVNTIEVTGNEANLNEVSANAISLQTVDESNNVSSSKPKGKVNESVDKNPPAILLKENVNVTNVSNPHEETFKEPVDAERVKDEDTSPVKKHFPAMVHDDVGVSNDANLHEEISKEPADRVEGEAASPVKDKLPTMVKDDVGVSSDANLHEEISKNPADVDRVEGEASSPVKKHLPAMVHDDVGVSSDVNLHEEISKEPADADRVEVEASSPVKDQLPTMVKDDDVQDVQEEVANDAELSLPVAELEYDEETVIEVSTREEMSRGSTKRRSRFKRVKSKIGSVLRWRRGSSKDEASIEGSFVSTVTVEDSAVSSLYSQADDESAFDPGQDPPSQRHRSSRWRSLSSMLGRPKTSDDSKATPEGNEAA